MKEIETELANKINAIIAKYPQIDKPLSAEMLRLGVVFCNPKYYKHYRKMTIEQFEAATLFYLSLNITTNEIEQSLNGKWTRLDDMFKSSEEGFIIIGDNFKSSKLAETDFVKQYRQFLIDNNIDVELNAGMVHWISCALESYV